MFRLKGHHKDKSNNGSTHLDGISTWCMSASKLSGKLPCDVCYVAGFLHKNRCIYNKKKPTFDYQKLFRFLSHSSTQFQVDNAKKAKYNNFCAISSIVHDFFRVSTIQLLHIMYILIYEDVKKVCCSYYGSE